MSTLDDNLAKRLKVTMGSESDPELVTPMAAGPDEVPDAADIFPIVRQFNDTNMGPYGSDYSRDTSRRGRRGKRD